MGAQLGLWIGGSAHCIGGTHPQFLYFLSRASTARAIHSFGGDPGWARRRELPRRDCGVYRFRPEFGVRPVRAPVGVRRSVLALDDGSPRDVHDTAVHSDRLLSKPLGVSGRIRRVFRRLLSVLSPRYRRRSQCVHDRGVSGSDPSRRGDRLRGTARRRDRRPTAAAGDRGPATPDVELRCPTCGASLKRTKEDLEPDFADGLMRIGVSCPGCADSLAVTVGASLDDRLDITKRVEREDELED